MISVVDATPDRWPAVELVMGTRGDPSRCWCQFFRLPGAGWSRATASTMREALHEQVAGRTPPGVLAFRGDEAVGWCAAGPRSSYPRLGRARVAQATDDAQDLWAVTCFVVRVGHRRQGIAEPLLDGAVDLARRHGAHIVEAYPVDVSQRQATAASLYHGPLHLFLRAGFTEVARPVPGRAVVRLEVPH
jgi:GNAT superfamily N-acetyltransferase